MNKRGFRRAGLAAIGLALAVLAAFGAGRVAGMAAPQLGPSQAVAASGIQAAWSGPWAEAQKVTENGQELGALSIGGLNIFKLSTVAGGKSPFERVQTVAQRINDALKAGAKPADFTPGMKNKLPVVLMNGEPIVTVDNALAAQMGKPGSDVAAQWAGAICSALQPPSPTVPAAQPAAADWTPPEPYADKYVPIISVLDGTELGVSRVNGPKSKVADVQAVAQIQAHFEDILQIDIYVPISTRVPGETLARVQGVGVTGLADIKL